MAWTDLLKVMIKEGLARTGYTVVSIERTQFHWLENVEPIARLFAKAEQFTPPPNDKRSRLLASLQGTTVVKALAVLKYLYAALSVDGDICEFGVAQGATSALLANEIDATGKHLWLFDSFAGLPEPAKEDGAVAGRDWAGALHFPRFLVEKRLRDIGFPKDRVHIVAGFFPDSAKRNAPERVSFAYIDFDFYGPIRDALGFVDRRMPIGGIVVVDDYGHPLFPGARKAVDEFVSSTDSFDVLIPDYAGIAVLTKRK